MPEINMKFIVEGIRSINMAHPKNEWKETEIRRDDLKSMMTNTKKLIEMYSELLKVKREGWENILKAKIREEEKKEQRG